MTDLNFTPDEELDVQFGSVRRLAPERGLGQDILLGVGVGFEDAVEGAFGLVDPLIPDSLFDLEENFLFGDVQLQTGAGRFASFATQFAVGFIPGMRIARVGGALARGVRGSNIVAKSLRGTMALADRLKGNPFGRAAVDGIVAGAIADFTVFDEREERLSNLIQDMPELANPVTEFLMADEDDGVLLGRIKNVIEGALVGGLFGVGLEAGVRGSQALARTTVRGIKAVKEARRARAEGASADVVQQRSEAKFREPVEEAAPEPEVVAPEPEPVVQPPPPEEPTTAFTQELRDEVEPAIRKTFEEFVRRSKAELPSATNPRAMSPDERLKAELERHMVGMQNLPESQQTQMVRSIERIMGEVLGEEAANKKGLWDLVDQLNAEQAADLKGYNDVDDFIEGEMPPEEFDALLDETVTATQQAAAARKLAPTIQAQLVPQAARFMRLGEGVLAKGADATNYEVAQAANQLVRIHRAAYLRTGLGEQAGGLLQSLNRADVLDIELEDMAEDQIEAHLARTYGSRQQAEAAIKEAVEEVQTTGDFSILYDNARYAQDPKTLANNKYTRAIGFMSVAAKTSSPKTGVTVGLSIMAQGMFMPLTRIAGGLLTARWTEMAAGAMELQTYLLGAINGSKVYSPYGITRRAFAQNFGGATNLPTLRAGFREDLPRNPNPLFEFAEGDGLLKTGIRWLGNAFSTGTRTLQALDLAATHVHRVASLRSQLFSDFAQNGNMTWGQAWKAADAELQKLSNGIYAQTKNQIVEEGFQLAISQGHKRGSKKAKEIALNHLQERWRPEMHAQADRELGRLLLNREPTSVIGKNVARLLREAPALRGPLPFIRTGGNVVAEMADILIPARTGLTTIAMLFPESVGGRLAKSNLETFQRIASDAVTNPRQGAEAAGRLGFSIAAGAALYNLAASGTITGGGSQSRAEQDIARRRGWQPYSIRIEDTYYSYERFDPFAGIMGVIADFVQLDAYASNDADDESMGMFSLAIGSLMQNLTSKTYLMGLTNMLHALNEPTKRGNRFIEQLVAGYVPSLSGTLAQTGIPGAADPDPFQRSIARGPGAIGALRGIANALSNRVPGLSSRMPERRNIFGERIRRAEALWADDTMGFMNFINPITVRTTSSDAINRELTLLGHGFTMPRRIQNGIDLTLIDVPGTNQTAYDRLTELVGTVLDNGVGVKRAASSMLKTPEYNALSPVSVSGEDSPRIAEWNKVLRRYRSIAYEQLLREVPDLRAAEQRRELGLQGRGDLSDIDERFMDRLRFDGLIQ